MVWQQEPFFCFWILVEIIFMNVHYFDGCVLKSSALLETGLSGFWDVFGLFFGSCLWLWFWLKLALGFRLFRFYCFALGLFLLLDGGLSLSWFSLIPCLKVHCWGSIALLRHDNASAYNSYPNIISVFKGKKLII